ncbi:prolipoprotein diacylglyceryl transferase [Acidisoma cellulosilytica]|uniref:Phosphatidylglycerol--prolipoprotein diacylglyceryl transferase n=1 Tax=Acidisoma cellulosilyticum TaxID=2802395 RepID=A0A963Z1D3_9PROT|nr:prolipoprotein diacylglyceryl transferase [Acidisoma cellulosilyticum]MCB8880028.1 prolipoprotein diacylglyceryl transferase [Acidisoma cellulosilyticum]
MKPLVFPDFNPILVKIGPFAIHWYAIAYIAGLVIGWRLVRRFVTWAPTAATPLLVDDFLSWATLGVVLGGRSGYVLFYQPGAFFAHPLSIFAVWDGGMSFHGGMLGVAAAIIWFCLKHRLNVLAFADRIAIVAPIGLGFGRLANFINGELWGRPAPAGWPGAMIFPRVDQIPRFPSELYEAFLEGLCLFVFMLLMAQSETRRRHAGALTGFFLVGYAVARSIGECFREPDAFLGFLFQGLTMGQLLCVPMLLAGIALLIYAYKSRPIPVTA